MPQIALYRDARGYVSPSRWDDGIQHYNQLLVYRL
ncbi:FimD/PapC N-terminal domain-containing protein [Escherichia coli]